MNTVRIISKPLAPPWNDASKNLAGALLSHAARYRYRFFGTEACHALERANVACDAIFRHPGGFEPGVWANLRPFLWLMRPESDVSIYHFFFSPNPRSAIALRTLDLFKDQKTVQTVCSRPASLTRSARVWHADLTVAVSDATRRALLAAGLTNVVRIYPGVEVPGVRDEAVGRIWRELDVPEAAPCILFSGDYEYSDAHHVILTALPDIFERNRDAVFIFACRPKTPRAARIEQRVRQCVDRTGWASRVRFLGQVANFAALLKAATLVVFPVTSLAKKMDLPLTLIEAMALGKPIVVSDLESLRELQPGDAGILVPPGDGTALAEAVLALLERADLRAEMGERGRQIAAERFAAWRMAEAYEECYSALLRDS